MQPRWRCLQIAAAGLALCGTGMPVRADTPAAGDGAAGAAGEAAGPAPQSGFFSSLKQAFQQNFDREIVRGHFDADGHRYYCLVDAKSGKREPNGVAGDPVRRSDGTTGINASAVSLYTCASAEQQGILVTNGYVLSPGAAAANASRPAAPSVPPAAPAPAAQPAPPIPAAVASPAADASPARIDVAGVRLGMSPDQVRAVLKARNLVDYAETTEALGRPDAAGGAPQPAFAGRFVNVIAAWTPPASAAAGQDAESYEIMFTPVPGGERAMAVVHGVAYSGANRVRESSVEEALIKKYAGFPPSAALPPSPTWRVLRDGSVQVGDACGYRGLFGGLGGLNEANLTRPNLALRTSAEEFRLQLEQCGVAIVTADHASADEGLPRGDRLIARLTVTAYSPSIGAEGAALAAQAMRRAADRGGRADARNQSPAPAF